MTLASRKVMFVEAFEAQVKKTPQAQAVDDWSYARLNATANRIAWALIERGVGPERIVALQARRSPEYLAALVGILKAGGAYLPLQVDGPSLRNQAILEQAQPLLVIHDIDKLPHPHEHNPDVPIGPGQLAYVLYTSGSTGKPKGAMLEHGGMVNHLESKAEGLGLVEGSCVAQTAPTSFDISIWQLLAPLLGGGRLVIFSQQLQQDLPAFVGELRRQKVTALELVPSHLQTLLAVDTHLPDLTYLIPTGEALLPGLCQRWLERLPQATMVNAYGPTECCDDVLMHYFRQPPDPTLPSVPLGQPVKNTHIYLLDEQLQPAREGEIYIGGVQVGRGYLGDPRRTAESFLEHPHWGRLYRTGDRARWQQDQLVFLGRADFQVKVNGVRIEIGEIEATLLRYPGVQEAVVKAWTNPRTRLVGYLSPQTLDLPAVKVWLEDQLPSAYIPGRLVSMPALPRTAHGKVDHAALRQPTEGASRPPKNERESEMKRLFEEVLGVTPVGLEENFFELGGHSILALELLARIQQQFHIRLRPDQLWLNPSVESLSTQVEKRPGRLVLPLKAGHGMPLVLLPGAGGTLFYLYELTRCLEGPVWGIQARGLADDNEPFTSIEEAARASLDELPDPPCLLVGHSLGAWMGYELALLLQDQGRPPAGLVVIDMPSPWTCPPACLQEDEWLVTVGHLFAEFGGRTLPGRVARMDSDELADWLQQEGLMPPSMGREPLRRLVRVFRAHHQMDYRPRRRFAGKITFIRSTSGGYSPINPAWGWHHFSSQPLQIHFLTGQHLSMLRPPCVQQLAQLILSARHTLQLQTGQD